MEDKIKQVFDNLNEEETDNLIKDSYVFESSLNEDRIKNMVLEKTGLKKRRNTLDVSFILLLLRRHVYL